MTDQPPTPVLERLERMEQLWAVICDRLDVVEEESCTNRNLIDELNEWREQLDDEKEQG